jgi:hypothetical protein
MFNKKKNVTQQNNIKFDFTSLVIDPLLSKLSIYNSTLHHRIFKSALNKLQLNKARTIDVENTLKKNLERCKQQSHEAKKASKNAKRDLKAVQKMEGDIVKFNKRYVRK